MLVRPSSMDTMFNSNGCYLLSISEIPGIKLGPLMYVYLIQSYEIHIIPFTDGETKT